MITEVPNLKVTELMTKYVLMVKPDMNILDAMERMIEKNFRCVFVVRQHPYKEFGLVTRFDVMAKVIGRGLNPLEVKVIDILEKPMVYIDKDRTVKEASKIMGENQICHLPVKEDGKVIGVISSSDIFEAYIARI